MSGEQDALRRGHALNGPSTPLYVGSEPGKEVMCTTTAAGYNDRGEKANLSELHHHQPRLDEDDGEHQRSGADGENGQTYEGVLQHSQYLNSVAQNWLKYHEHASLDDDAHPMLIIQIHIG